MSPSSDKLEWEEVACNLCGSSRNSPWVVKDGYRIVKCSDCNLIYVNPRPVAKAIQEHYDEAYFLRHSTGPMAQKRMKMYQIEIEDLSKLVPRGRILDVGCGGGFLLNTLGNHWEKYGVEVNPSAAEFARRHFGLKVTTGTFQEAHFPDEFFDVVEIRGVIEHLPDPKGVLLEAHRVLKKGGIVSINTPNIDSFVARLYKEKFGLVEPPVHIYYFSTKTISRMLEVTGFRIVKKSFFYTKTPYASWKDPLKIMVDLFRLTLARKSNFESPPFFRNVINIYGAKK